MSVPATSTPHGVYLLADHLDAVLAAGEDLLKLEVDIEGVRRSDGATAPWQHFEGLVATARMLELTLVSRALQARRWAKEVGREMQRHEPVIGLMLGVFAGGIAALEDAVAELADRTAADFDTGLDPLAYMRTRGLIAADAGTLHGARTLAVTDSFLVARRIELGPLLDMSAALLDALDAAYSLFAEAEMPARREESGDVALAEGKSQGLGQA